MNIKHLGTFKKFFINIILSLFPPLRKRMYVCTFAGSNQREHRFLLHHYSSPLKDVEVFVALREWIERNHLCAFPLLLNKIEEDPACVCATWKRMNGNCQCGKTTVVINLS